MGSATQDRPDTQISVGSPPAVSEQKLRRWLTLLRQPDRLVAEDIEDFLEAHGVLPESKSALALGQAGAQLILNGIERLRPPEGASREERLPYEVLNECFIEGAKLFTAAATLGVSERQLSRERSRAIRLLKAELENFPRQVARPDLFPEPIPRIGGFLERPAERRRLEKAFNSARLVVVHGPPGIGKTTLVAEVVSAESISVPLLWYRFRAGVNTSLTAVLFEIADHLNSNGEADLIRYLEQSLPLVDVSLATRLAIRTLGGGPHCLVFDDYQLVEEDTAIKGLVEEMVERLPEMKVIVTSRRRYLGIVQGEAVEIRPLTRQQSARLIATLGVSCGDQMLKSLHGWTKGNPHMLKLAASWLKKASHEQVTEGVASLREQAEVQQFLLEQVTNLIDPDDQKILEGASIFRSHFNDDALAFVTGRTRGAVMDTSIRLVRAYIATRNREGDSAFFHNSVRDFVYERIEPDRRAELHRRAADWFERAGRATEAQHHRHCAQVANSYASR